MLTLGLKTSQGQGLLVVLKYCRWISEKQVLHRIGESILESTCSFVEAKRILGLGLLLLGCLMKEGFLPSLTLQILSYQAQVSYCLMMESC